jgi:hypothetical protein
MNLSLKLCLTCIFQVWIFILEFPQSPTAMTPQTPSDVALEEPSPVAHHKTTKCTPAGGSHHVSSYQKYKFDMSYMTIQHGVLIPPRHLTSTLTFLGVPVSPKFIRPF